MIAKKAGYSEDELEKILDSEDRTKAGVTLSPNGLYLMEILYDKF